MAKRAGAYKSEKRKKEVMRQKKQEEKRQRRTVVQKHGEEVKTDSEPTAPERPIEEIA